MSTDFTADPHGSPLFLHDSFDLALTKARTEDKLLFVDAWAPWCHTCLSMQSEVLEEPEISRFADRVVFVALDTDRPENAGFLERYAVRVWPTFYAIDPGTQLPVAAYGGSLSKDEMVRLLETAIQARMALKQPDAGDAKLLADAHAQFAARDYRAAEQSFRAALSKGSARRMECFLGILRSLEKTDPIACVHFGIEHMTEVQGAATPIDFVSYSLSCAEKLSTTEEVNPLRERMWQLGRERLSQLAVRADTGASVDDRADAYALLANIEEASGNADAAKRAHEQRLNLMLATVARAKNVSAARVHDYARMVSYLALGRGADAVAMFEERTRQFPKEYEPWARLASTLHKMGRQAEALAAVEQAVKLAYGPRALRYMQLKSDILAKLDRQQEAQATLETTLATCRALPQGQRDPERCSEIERLLRKPGPSNP